MKSDIVNREDIVLLVDSFYEKVNLDSVLGPIFNRLAKVEWSTHLPIMYSFWASLLFQEHSYLGNPMEKHVALAKSVPMGSLEFSAWLSLFNQTIDEHFEGAKADEAKVKASSIAALMELKIKKSKQ